MAKVYRGVCHTPCYWLETLWLPGETYEGNIPAIHHFSDDGKLDKPLPPPDAGADPRSNKKLRGDLKKAPFNFVAPSKWSRKQLWSKLHEFERAEGIDELTSPSKPNLDFVAPCGFLAKNVAGKVAHQRQCEECATVLE